MDDATMRGRQAAEAWPHDALPKGAALQGYRIDRILGRGGFGITYRVSDVIGQAFALKEFFPEQYARREGLAVRPVAPTAEEVFHFCLDRFLREARALVRLTGEGGSAEGIVRVNTLFEANGTAYLVMELLRGETLQALIESGPGGIDRARLRGLMVGVLTALGAVHMAGMLHRDVKPANIFLRGNGAPVLIDFGAVRARYRDGPQVPFTLIYSEKFAPIEQMQGDLQEPSADLYAFGATMYMAVGGSLISAMIRTKALNDGKVDPLAPARVLAAGRYDDDLLQAIDRCLRVDAGQRPQSTSEVLKLLSTADTIVVPSAVLGTVTARPAPRRAAGRTLLIGGLVALVLVVAATGGWFWFEQRQAVERDAQDRAARQKAEEDAARAAREIERQKAQTPPPAQAPIQAPPPEPEPAKPAITAPIPVAVAPLPAPVPKQPTVRPKAPGAVSLPSPAPIAVQAPRKSPRQLDPRCSELLAKSSLGVDPLTGQEREYFKSQCQ